MIAESKSQARRLTVQTGQLVSVSGQPISSAEVRRCPTCGAGGSARQIVTGFGGHWRVLCSCGREFDSGTGTPPVEGEI